uniref:Genome polyprotein n=1 Tax=Japanese yam mosaic virus TaxID=79917 RepID=A0A097EV83_9POTV|nr:polyprotein [Japanese yam mosaic virus]
MATIVHNAIRNPLDLTELSVQHQFQFGSFPKIIVTTLKGTDKVLISTPSPIQAAQRKQMHDNIVASRNKQYVENMKQEYAKQCSMFKKWEEEYTAKRQANPNSYKITWTKQQRNNMRRHKAKLMREERLKQEKVLAECVVGPWGPPVFPSSIANGPKPSEMEEDIKWPLHCTRSKRTRGVKCKPLNLSLQSYKKLFKDISNIIICGKKNFEITDKHTNKANIKKKGKRIYIKVATEHEEGRNFKRDVKMGSFACGILGMMLKRTSGNCHHKVESIQPGYSGFVINKERIIGPHSRSLGDIFIVRGNHEGKLYEARIKLSYSIRMGMTHYSSPGVRFWNGFNTAFLKNRGQNRSHTCETDLDVEECGEVAALLCLALCPCGKITCNKCVEENLLSEGQATHENLLRKQQEIKQIISEKHPQFRHALQILERQNQALQSVNSNYKNFTEIHSISEGRSLSAFSHASRINDVLMKGGRANADELSDATRSLLEIVRYLKNKTESPDKGTLKTFRNKISQKAHLNPALMCDNQLDDNGNFVWGERGYHAKRFFNKYFEIINPSKGYGNFELRINPRGQRKTAINRLIVPTNFEMLREQMQGESIGDHPLTVECTSKLNGDFVYSCCCVTNDSGEPILSELQMPTKNHLVVGNSGDSKYVDMPPQEGQLMYIAKSGYCYMNIFLAMLVNVRKEDAKAFTKMVRDVLIDKLGSWPSLLDVASACYLLKVFFPDVSNAELPRILVDHKSKTMHVIDSYGSLNTGYHILKANTVEQLTKFMRAGLESNMKHYLVGGPIFNNDDIDPLEYRTPSWHLKRLIKGIYNPKILLEDIRTDRYLPLYALLSPGVLIAMYNSSSLEILTKEYLRKDDEFVAIVLILESLARKVSVSTSLMSQLMLIEGEAQYIIEAVQGIKQRYPIPYTVVMEMLVILASRSESDAALDAAGFKKFQRESAQLMEKNYLRILEDEWRELSLCQKLSAISRSSRLSMRTRGGLQNKSIEDLGGRYSESMNFYFGEVKNGVIKVCKKIGSKVKTTTQNAQASFKRKVLSCFNYFIPDIFKFINVLVCLTMILTLAQEMHAIVERTRNCKRIARKFEFQEKENKIKFMHQAYHNEHKEDPTFEEFIEYLGRYTPELVTYFQEDAMVSHQAKRRGEVELERVVAFIALVMMVFDTERSDCVVKILNKLKNIVSSTDADVFHQGLSEIEDDLNEKKLTIDFELSQDGVRAPPTVVEHTFSTWWAHQISNGRTIPHYRTEGHFMTFTRASAHQVATEIATSEHKDILLMGAVGSGKSTGLPFHLSKRGRVLLVEPTRPLAENVYRQLSNEPFFVNATLLMRGLTTCGSSPVTIMTSGFALNQLAHNRQRIAEYDFVIFDECHVHDANAMALSCLLYDSEFPGKIIKVSATPPGREVEFKTQHPVKLLTEESLGLKEFVAAQGTGVNSDVIRYGDNILVYVASYNEVDNISKALIDKGFKVTKVDGRTMKVGKVEIVTSGTSQRKHFIVATNIIENGVTLDIDVVVDFGTKVVPYLDVDNRMMLYQKIAINYGERIQRLGRVGRHKAGTALRIGHTERGLSEIPSCIATEAAFRCFTFGLPVITNNVTTSLLANATVRQARTMAHFELSPFYTYHFVRFDGTMHPEIHKLFKRFKLRDSEIVLNKTAIPHRGINTWFTSSAYQRLGANVGDSNDIRIPFLCKDIPETLHELVWDVIVKHRGDAGFGKLSSASACKIAYTLKTDVMSIQRTIHIIDALIVEERKKQEYFKTITTNTISSSNFSLQSIANAIRARFTSDHTIENISVLENAKAQLCEFKNLNIDAAYQDFDSHVGQNFISNFGALEAVYHQSEKEMSEHFKLKGRWNKSLITRDIMVMVGVLVGGVIMVYKQFTSQMKEDVFHEAKGKRQRQRLRFRDARDNKLGREVFGDDGTMEHYFGEAYTKKGKTSGRTHGMGRKQRKFVNMYSFDPEDFSAVRFVDVLTGATLDEAPITDLHLVQEHFTNIRSAMIESGELESQHLYSGKGVNAYYMNKRTGKALQVDLTPHNPLLICSNKATIAGFPEREYELRQTGQPKEIAMNDIPKVNEMNDIVQHESSSLHRGLRDYNPISNSICQLVNRSDGGKDTIYGLGFGPMIVTNRHLFERNGGELDIKTRHGDFLVKNTKQLQLFPIPDRDLILIKLPKDMPPFPQKLQFRQPERNEKICMVGSNFQAKSVTNTVSETSIVLPMENCHFWKHWISTKDGQCGLPLVSSKDGNILGIHSLGSFNNTINYFASFPADFVSRYLLNPENHEWVQHWKYNTDNISWGALKIHKDAPTGLFKTTKLIGDLESLFVHPQMKRERWMFEKLEGNLKAIATCPSQLVTKHVVKGKCPLFDMYMKLDEEAKNFFTPLLGQYQKSCLNKEAYIKDVMKYSTVIEVGNVQTSTFEKAVQLVIHDLKELGFETCQYITNEECIFGALNMKSAVGALYGGKKKEYFQDFTQEMKEQILKHSCQRLYMGKMGLWNGSLKAELRPLEKVQANKTRTFTAAPLDTLLGGKTCVDDFNNQFYDLNIVGPWSVGMTKFYGGWNELLEKLPEGWTHCDADGSQFDSSLSPYLINAVLNIRLHFMEKWDIGEQMLRNLYTEIVYTPIATPDSTIVKKFKGNNSGQPSTVVDNTLMVLLALKYSLLKDGIKAEKQKDVVKYFVNGDDLLLSVDPNFEHVLDTMQDNFRELGLKYTFDSRTKKKEELWFMSHKGMRVEGMWIPKLEPERIVSILEWDRSKEPCHRMEAICAAMIESWGYTDLTHQIRRFYAWLLGQAPYSGLAEIGKAPYIAESALRKLYLDKEADQSAIEKYLRAIFEDYNDEVEDLCVYHQSGEETLDAGTSNPSKIKKQEGTSSERTAPMDPFEGFDRAEDPTGSTQRIVNNFDKDVNVGTVGTFAVPRLKGLTTKMNMPKVRGKAAMNLEHLLVYNPEQTDLSNTRATRKQFDTWYDGVKRDYELDDNSMQIILNGLMVWCIENGTSPNINGMWVMMDGEEQIEYPIKPLIDHAKPTFRQIMAHFSNVAEAYIEKRNQEKAYMPRYGLQRNLTDMSLARYAFDFYEITSKTPARAREAHIQMKAAALRGAQNKLFGLDGNVSTMEENTERHTAEDVNRNMHSLLGVRGV